MRDPWPDLAAGQMTALSGLGALRQLDLDLARAYKILARDAEPPRSDLLDGGVFLCTESHGLLAALAGVGLSAQAVHHNGKAAVRFFGDGAVRHGAGFEAPDDAGGWLDLAQRNCLCFVKAKPEQAAQRMRQQFIVNHGGVPAEAHKITGTNGLLQRQNGQRIIHVIFHLAAGAEFMEAGGIDSQISGQIHRVKRPVMPPDGSVVHLLQADAADAADCVRKIPVYNILADADGLKNLCSLIRLHAGNAHFGRDPHDAVQNGLIIGIDRGIVVLVERPFSDEFADAVLCEIGIDGARAIAEERGEMVHVARFGALKDQRDRRALFRAYKILLHGGHCQQGWNGDVVLIHTTV